MIVTHINLNQFRNYKEQEIAASPGINVFFGDNAQGKTNILEAVYLCTCARSHRTAKDSDLILRQTDHYAIKVDFKSCNGSSESVEIQYLDAVAGDEQRNRAIRHIYHNNMRLERISDLMGLFHAVIFAPEDLMLVKEGPATRRRYLDLLISQVRPSYFLHLQQFARILAQRNKLLKDLREQGFGRQKPLDEARKIQLDVWNDTLAKEGAAIITQRMCYSERIAQIAMDAQVSISSGKEQLYVKYRSITGLSPDKDENEIVSLYASKLKSMVCEDIEKGVTGQGPHRDDLDLSLDGSGLKPFASQGQQRSAVLALKLAELVILKQDTGETPVFLLDDVMSELDEKRRTSLLQNIDDAQVFVTCTDARQVYDEMIQKKAGDEGSKSERPYAFFKVENGQVSRQEIDLQA
ncbi:MAG: DNA replication/repair protein RecF [Eubacteriales bacterium]|mgnify:CR=1 FL=1|nr:DNA replication/repair protein RecF [Eubacteriales bacterium]MDD4018247.1 DNA replication/repair protein RecF [Kiritimatiellia bacterium]NLV85452.1 DNA replication/repair protein RecF [Spirochaetales bacterium]